MAVGGGRRGEGRRRRSRGADDFRGGAGGRGDCARARAAAMAGEGPGGDEILEEEIDVNYEPNEEGADRRRRRRRAPASPGPPPLPSQRRAALRAGV